MRVYIVVGVYDVDYGDMYCQESENLGVYSSKEVAEKIALQFLQIHEVHEVYGNVLRSAEINVFELDEGKVESYEIESDGKVNEK